MDDLSKAFSILTGSDCRCCVKTIDVQGGVLGVETLCRQTDCHEEDPFHPIAHNSDFEYLYHNKGERWFLANDLPRLAAASDYRNTSKDWNKRYRAAAIWPIRRR